MYKTKVGDRLQIQCYKHDGSVHRSWNEAVLLKASSNYLVFGNHKTTVTRSNGNIYKTKEPAIMYFFKKEWFNIIVQLKRDGIYYYCNIASPYLIEENTIKYIDYDLDLRVFPTGEFKILDKIEYNYHKKIMNYSNDLDRVIHKGLNRLIYLYKSKAIMFDTRANLQYYEKYKKLQNNKDK